MIGTNNLPRALVATGKQVKLNRFDRVGEAWQDTLWEVYRDLGAVHYGMTFKRSASMRVNYFVAEQDEDTEEPTPTDNTKAQEAFDRLGDVATLVGDMVVQLNVAGEGWLVGQDGDGEEFEVLSSVEVRKRLSGEGGLGDMTVRVWLPAPWDKKKADSPLRSVQAQCEQLLLLNDEIGATAMSRIPAGFLLVPTELSFAIQNADDNTAPPDGDPFMAEIIEIVTTAINNPDAAARVAPNVIRGDAEYLKEFRYEDIARQMDETFAGMRDELLRQIAGGINLPAEILTGLADLNHWSLWGIDESTAKHHVDPDVLTILQSFTEGYLWPALEEDGMSPEEARRFQIWRDYSDLTSRPLTIEQALALRVEGVINDEYVRMVANIPEDYAGSGVAKETETPEDPRANQDPPENIAAAASTPLRELAAIDTRLSERIIEASEAALQRTLERAGVKVRNKARKNREVTAAIQNVANDQVTQFLGAMRIEALQVTLDELVPANEFDALSSRISRLIEKAQDDRNDWLAGFLGVELARTPAEDEDRITAVDLFIASILAAVTARLFTGAPDPDPAEEGEFSDEIATSQMVALLLTQAGGAEVTEFTPETPRGLALGERTRSILRDHGYRTESLTWEWAYFRTPQTPYEPHLSLDGAVVLDREDPRLGGYYPGDHRFCSCSFVPTVLPEG